MTYLGTRAESIVHDYLSAIGQDSAGPLGGDESAERADPKKHDPEAVSRMISRFQARQREATGILKAAVIALFVLLALAAAVIYYHRMDPKVVAGVLGGQLLGLLVIVVWLRRLWLEKTVIDTLLILIASMPPVEAAQLIIRFHFRSLRARTVSLRG
jgi:hypothetical protein